MCYMSDFVIITALFDPEFEAFLEVTNKLSRASENPHLGPKEFPS
jgi:hypothetical protein